MGTDGRHCASCGYALEGLPAEATCPECGRYTPPDRDLFDRAGLRARRARWIWQIVAMILLIGLVVAVLALTIVAR